MQREVTVRMIRIVLPTSLIIAARNNFVKVKRILTFHP